jgi:hypothetical protein
VHGSSRSGHGVGFLDLSQNLRLSNDHGIEAGRDTKQMPDSFALAEFVQIRFIRSRLTAKIFAEESSQVGMAILGASQHLDTIASAQD